MTGLSCYTANLTAYLRRLRPDADRFVARSVALAVGTDQPDDLLAFSHHVWPLNSLPDGRALGYRAAPAAGAALDGLAAELAATGAVLVVADSARLPWSPAGALSAPHFVLADGRAAGRWHILDEFRALTAGGLHHEPFSGWIPEAALVRMIEPLTPLRPEHRLRNQLAFGAPVPLPEPGQFQWLAVGTRTADPLPDGWVVDPARALDVLAERLADPLGSGDDRLLEDVWAAAQHHLHRYGVLAGDGFGPMATAAAAAWRTLPRTLRFAVDSARRGRPRPSLVAAAFAELRRIEDELYEPLRDRGFGCAAGEVRTA